MNERGQEDSRVIRVAHFSCVMVYVVDHYKVETFITSKQESLHLLRRSNCDVI